MAEQSGPEGPSTPGTPHPASPPAASAAAPVPSGQAVLPIQATPQTAQQQLDGIPIPDNWTLLDRLASEAQEPFVTLFVGNGDMLRFGLIQPLYQVLKTLGGRQPNLTLFLRSTGGFAEVPWKIVALLREYTNRLRILVPEVAHSGATHITLAADDLVMTEAATLSSVDPTRRHPLLPRDKDGNQIPASVQDLKHCVEFIKGQLGRRYSGTDIAAIIRELFSHVHPLALGAIEQSAELSKMITRKVLATRQKALAKDHVERIVEQLAGKYYSHVFPISRVDVERDLGVPVSRPSVQFTQVMEDLLGYYQSASVHVGQGQINNVPVRFIRSVFIESPALRKVCYVLVNDKGEVVGDFWKTVVRGGGGHAPAAPRQQGAGQRGTAANPASR